MKFRITLLYVFVPTNVNDGTTLVSSLQPLLVQEEFYSIKNCTVIGLLGVSLLLHSVSGIQHSLKRANRNHNVTAIDTLLSLLSN